MEDCDDEPPVDAAVAKLAERYEREGVDTRFCEQPFLEASELGDVTSLRRRLGDASAEERWQLIKSVDQHGRTPLLLIAKSGEPEMVELLLDAVANPNETDTHGVTALHYSAARGSAAIVKPLLHGRADVDVREEGGETPLMWAFGVATVNLLLGARADAHARSRKGKTALMFASYRCDMNSIEALAGVLGTELDTCDSEGCSAYAAAMSAGHPEAAELLVSLGATSPEEPSARVVRCEEAFHEAARQGDADACAALLQENRFQVRVDAEVAGETALLLAASSGHGRAVEVLLHGKADPNRADAFMQETPLMRVVLGNGSDELLWMLLEARADPSLKDIAGRAPSDVAAAWGRPGSAEMLAAAAAGQLPLSEMD